MPTSSPAIPVGIDAYFEMTSLSLAGGLAACRACIESWYTTSEKCAQLYLDAAANVGLLNRTTLFRLSGRMGRFDDLIEHEKLALSERLYIPTPEYSILFPDLARSRVELARDRVGALVEAYHFALRGSERERDEKIGAAWDVAWATGIALLGRAGAFVRGSSECADVHPHERLDGLRPVLSPLAKLHLLIASVRRHLAGEGQPADRNREAIGIVVDFVEAPARNTCQGGGSANRPRKAWSDQNDGVAELLTFALQLLAGRRPTRIPVGAAEGAELTSDRAVGLAAELLAAIDADGRRVETQRRFILEGSIEGSPSALVVRDASGTKVASQSVGDLRALGGGMVAKELGTGYGEFFRLAGDRASGRLTDSIAAAS